MLVSLGINTWRYDEATGFEKDFSPACGKINEGGNTMIYYLICEAKPLQHYRRDELLCGVIVTLRGHHAPKAIAERERETIRFCL